MEPLLSRYSVVLATIAEIILVISGIIFLAIICGLNLLVWWVCPITALLITIMALPFFKVLDHSLNNRQALFIIFIYFPLMIYTLSWLLSQFTFED